MAGSAAAARQGAKSAEAKKNKGQDKEDKKKAEAKSPVSRQSSSSRKSIADQILPDDVSTGLWKYQQPLRRYYKHPKCEIFVAALIVGNFLTNMMEKTIDPGGPKGDEDTRKYDVLWEVFEYFYNVCFTVELAINMYSHWLWHFWKSGWNVFDFVVVMIGVLTMLKLPLPGPLKLLRMMRAFRVFRLFKRVQSLKKIMESLARAVPGVINAFVILVLVMCIYAILGVEFFRLFGDGGHFVNEDGKKVGLTTSRGQDYGWEYFGNFPKSLYTMFQVLTGESWSEVVARPLIHGEDALQSTAFALFFVSFVVLNAIILINVVVAVLLEKMVDDGSADEAPDDDESETVSSDEEANADEDELLRRCAKDLKQSKQDASLMKEQLAAILKILQQPPGATTQVPKHLYDLQEHYEPQVVPEHCYGSAAGGSLVLRAGAMSTADDAEDRRLIDS